MSEGRFGSTITRIRAWAENEASVRAALVVGSQVRTVAPADEWSDLDVVLFHTEPDRLVESTDWIHQFGEVLFTFVEQTAVLNSRERRVLYSDSRDVDFAVFPSRALPLLVQSPEGLSVLARGCRILLDKDSMLSDLDRAVSAARALPSAVINDHDFQACVADFWYHALWTAKKLRRGELWVAKLGCDGHLKRLLQTMLTWQATVVGGAEAEVWPAGRFLDSWADPRARRVLPATFGRYEFDDLSRALTNTTRLFAGISRDVAKARNWQYPEQAESKVLELVAEALRLRPGPKEAG